jgi:nucleotide-binding universal stress UspA family protein
MNKYFDTSKKVLVAISFDDHARDLIKLGVAICKATGMHLRLVHVCEPWMGGVGFGIVPLPEVNSAVQDELMFNARAQLQELAKSVDVSVKVETAVHLGPTVDLLTSDAAANQAGLIMCGRASCDYPFLPRGLSTALNLMSYASCPVLVVPRSVSLNLQHRGSLTFVVADDLSDSAQSVVKIGAAFATSLGAKMMHVHALGLNEEQLQMTLNAATAAGRSMARISAKEFAATLTTTVRTLMEKRVDKQEMERAGTYVVKILEGDAYTALQELGSTLPTNDSVLVFGRHHSVHRKPFMLGRLPLKTMLKSNHAVLLIPV